MSRRNKTNKPAQDAMLTVDSVAVKKTLDHLNSIGKMLEKLYDKMEMRLSDIGVTYRESEALGKGKQEVSTCKKKLAHIRTKVENLINNGQTGKNDLLRVITMKSDLDTESYECPICLSPILKADRIWSCSACFHVHHLDCVLQHANNRVDEYGVRVDNLGNIWNCPVCRSPQQEPAALLQYLCFCGAVASPKVVAGRTAHSCGSKCRRTHYCTLQCHPAACPKQ